MLTFLFESDIYFVMIGWINLSIEHFITETFGLEIWKEVIAKSEIDPNWISSCPYSDKVTYE